MLSVYVSLDTYVYYIFPDYSIRGIRMMSERAIARDGRAIVCLHPRQEVDVELTKVPVFWISSKRKSFRYFMLGV